jgi:hypothetical protein
MGSVISWMDSSVAIVGEGCPEMQRNATRVITPTSTLNCAIESQELRAISLR